jgi:hypothetical protein
MLDRMQKEYADVSETCRQLERSNAAMELQLERAKACGKSLLLLLLLLLHCLLLCLLSSLS